jgi:hypothetical protein
MFVVAGRSHGQRPVKTNMCKARSRNYILEASVDERLYRSKHVEQSRNNIIINCPTQLHLAGHFYKICMMMYVSMNEKFKNNFCLQFL